MTATIGSAKRAEILKLLRENTISIRDIARQTGVARSTINRIRREHPNIRVVYRRVHKPRETPAPLPLDPAVELYRAEKARRQQVRA